MFCLCSQNFPLVLTFATLLYLKNKQINKYNWDFNLTPLVWHQNVVELDISLFTTSHTLMTSILIFLCCFLLENTLCAPVISLHDCTDTRIHIKIALVFHDDRDTSATGLWPIFQPLLMLPLWLCLCLAQSLSVSSLLTICP